MEKSVLFIGESEWLYREQRLCADFGKMGCSSLKDAMQIKNLSETVRKSVELVFVELKMPFPVSIFNDDIMPFLPNAGVLFLIEDPIALISQLKLDFGTLPTYVYGVRKSATPWLMNEAIDIAFASNHHETAKTDLKERWGVHL